MTPTGPVGGNALDLALYDADGAPALLGAPDGPRPTSGSGCCPSTTSASSRPSWPAAAGRPAPRDQGRPRGRPRALRRRQRREPAHPAGPVRRRRTRPRRGHAHDPGLAQPSIADERDLHLEGFLTFVDRPKADAGASLAKLAHLGVAVKIITGDNGAVAAKVCRDLGLAVEQVVTGADIDHLEDPGLLAAIPHTTVFARVSPEQKSRIIKVARTGAVDVAFLGDGVNDAVALHAADVGISVDSAADVAKDAADIVLLEKDLGVLADGVTEGRRIFANTMKYVLMATSSNFGNMFSAAGASLFLSFLPMLPSQILLNNLLYDVGQLAIPGDRVDPEVLARPAAWDIAFVRRFMAVFGPVSSIFDFLTFFVMLVVLNAGHAEFRTGWFVESLATQTLVVFVIRTRRSPSYTSRPSRAMTVLPIACASVGALLPITPLAPALGFTPLPIAFFAILVAMIVGLPHARRGRQATLLRQPASRARTAPLAPRAPCASRPSARGALPASERISGFSRRAPPTWRGSLVAVAPVEALNGQCSRRWRSSSVGRYERARARSPARGSVVVGDSGLRGRVGDG